MRYYARRVCATSFLVKLEKLEEDEKRKRENRLKEKRKGKGG